MKVKFFIWLILACAVSACKKSKAVYTPEINLSINTQTAAMTMLYDLVQMHHVTAEGGTHYTDNCFQRTADTNGVYIYDTMTVNATNSCGILKANITSGVYMSEYRTTFPSILDTIAMNIDFTSNGVNLKGRINYFYQTLSLVRVLIEDMEVTDTQGGLSKLNAGFFMVINVAETNFSGVMDFSGALNFAWNSKTDLFGPNHFANGGLGLSDFYLKTGLATFDFGSTKMEENFGDGQDDNLATITDQSGERKILVLPRL